MLFRSGQVDALKRPVEDGNRERWRGESVDDATLEVSSHALGRLDAGDRFDVRASSEERRVGAGPTPRVDDDIAVFG